MPVESELHSRPTVPGIQGEVLPRDAGETVHDQLATKRTESAVILLLWALGFSLNRRTRRPTRLLLFAAIGALMVNLLSER